MLKFVDDSGVAHDVFIANQDAQPVKLCNESATLSEPYTTTVSGESIISVDATYNDQVDNLAVYGVCEQDGTPSPDNPVEIQSVGGTVVARGRNLCDMTAVGMTYLATDIETTSSMASYTARTNGSNYITVGATTLRAGCNYVLSGHVVGDGQIMLRTRGGAVLRTPYYCNADVDVCIYLYGNQYGTAVAGTRYIFEDVQLEVGTTPTPYQPYYPPVTIDIPDLYAVGDVQDVMYVDHEQGRAWVERNCGYLALTSLMDLYTSTYHEMNGIVFSEVLPEGMTRRQYVSNQSTWTSPAYVLNKIWVGGGNRNVYWLGILDILGLTTIDEFKAWLDENPTYVIYQLATPTIEELDYTALPTNYKGTVIEVDSEVVPVVEATVKTWQSDEYNNVTAVALTALGLTPSADQEENIATLSEIGVDAYIVEQPDTSDTYADEVEALGVQSTNDAETNIEILSKLGVSVYE